MDFKHTFILYSISNYKKGFDTSRLLLRYLYMLLIVVSAESEILCKVYYDIMPCDDVRSTTYNFG